MADEVTSLLIPIAYPTTDGSFPTPEITGLLIFTDKAVCTSTLLRLAISSRFDDLILLIILILREVE